MSPLKKSNGDQQSSGSSTASGPTSKRPLNPSEPFKQQGECPKTEDFLTFLCLRGTNLCPPEFDVFNRASIPPARSSDDESNEGSSNNEKPPPRRRKSIVSQSAKVLPESVKALKKKYTEQRIVRKVISQKLEKSSSVKDAVKLRRRKSVTTHDNVRHKITTNNAKAIVKTDAKITRNLRVSATTGLRRGLRSSRATRASMNGKSLRSTTIKSTIKKPSAATIIAKQKRRIATLNATSKNASRMLTRLTPRGTSSAAFVRKAKKMDMDGKSLRGRNISLSSEEEEENNEMEAVTENEGYKGRKMVCRKTASNVRRDSDDDSEDDDEEVEEVEDEDEKQPLKKDSAEIVPSKRPNRKTKEAATVYLNMVAHKLTKNVKDDDDISVESLSEATQEKRLEEVAQADNPEKRKVKYKERKIITPSLITPSLIKKKKLNEDITPKKDVKELKDIKEIKDAKEPTKDLMKEIPKDEKSNSSDSGDMKKVPKDKKDKDKKNKNSLKEMQDRLLLEAKKKIACTPEAAPLVPKQPQQPPMASTSINANEEKKPPQNIQPIENVEKHDRINISQRTGYIQVKSRPSFDSDEPPQQIVSQPQGSQPGSIGQQRRLSNPGPCSTPPRKILPKDNQPVATPPPINPVVTAPPEIHSTGHLPVGVVGAALSSSRPQTLITPITIKGENPLSNTLNGSTPPPTVPLSQPLLINTSMNPHQQPQPHPMVTQIAGPHQGGIISAIRMPTIIRPTGGVPIMMPQIALPNGSILQPVAVTSSSSVTAGPTIIRSPFVTAYGQPMQLPTAPVGAIPGQPQQPQMPQMPHMSHMPQLPQQPLQPQMATITPVTGHNLTPVVSAPPLLASCSAHILPPMMPSISTVSNTFKCNTDVTITNTQPLVSPGPPLLSPQFQQSQPWAPPVSQVQQITKNTPVSTPPKPVMTPMMPTGPTQSRPMVNFTRPVKPNNTAPPILTPAGLPVTSGAVIRSVLPMAKGKTQFSRLPSASNVTHMNSNQKPRASTNIVTSTTTPTKPTETTPLSMKSKTSNTPAKTTSATPSIPVTPTSKASGATKTPISGASKTPISGASKTPIFSSKNNTPVKESSSSFRVDDETSPYAFEPEPLERPSVPYRKKEQVQQTEIKKEKQPFTPAASASKTDESASSHKKKSAGSANSSTAFAKAKQPSMEDFNLKDINSSISLPPELASQLAAQAQSEGASSSAKETTYFIPLQSNSSGQSFGVAVKLGTEGPPGPDQKVIMKAKLVTQPVGKPLGATVIGAPKKDKTPRKKPEKKEKAPVKRPPSSSSSSEDEESSADSESSEDEKPPKKQRKKSSPKQSTAVAKNIKRELKSPAPSTTSSMVSPRSDTSSPKSKRKKDATLVSLPVTSPTISSRSQQTCLGVVESLEKFPKLGQHAHLIEAPIFKPTPAEFKDPMKYIQAIRKVAEPFGMCKIIPPASFKPECNVDDDMRFTAYNQYVHKLMNRWGPNSKEMAAIKKYLETQNVTINASNHPMISGVEIDLPALYHAVQSLGGLTEVIQKKKWGKIAEFLRVPKGTQDRSNKFYDIYCKFLLPYDTLSNVEREELFKLVEEEFEERSRDKDEEKDKDNEDSEEEEEEEEEENEEDYECVLKGKSTSLSQFFRVAKNWMTMVFKEKFEPDAQPDLRDVEEEYWQLVQERDSHVQVQQGSIDTGSSPDGSYGFPTSRNSSCGRHPWNLKILSNNRHSLLRTMGPVTGVTVPTLHIGMLFTTACWYRDPHGLPWIEYHHTGAPKVWFGVPDSHSIAFYTAMKQLAPSFCRKKKIWLTQDSVMMPPNLLVKHGVSVSRCIQEQGQFMVVFPKAYTSHVCTGYTVSESVYFATRDFLSISENEFENIRDSRDPMLFPLPKLLLCIAKDEKSSRKTLRMIKPMLEKMRDNEYVKRTMISDLGVKSTERINLKSGSKKQREEDEYECETCSINLYVSFVSIYLKALFFSKITYLPDESTCFIKKIPYRLE